MIRETFLGAFRKTLNFGRHRKKSFCTFFDRYDQRERGWLNDESYCNHHYSKPSLRQSSTVVELIVRDESKRRNRLVKVSCWYPIVSAIDDKKKLVSSSLICPHSDQGNWTHGDPLTMYSGIMRPKREAMEVSIDDSCKLCIRDSLLLHLNQFKELKNMHSSDEMSWMRLRDNCRYLKSLVSYSKPLVIW